MAAMAIDFTTARRLRVDFESSAGVSSFVVGGCEEGGLEAASVAEGELFAGDGELVGGF